MGFVRSFCLLMDKFADGGQNERERLKFDNISFKENKDIVYFEGAREACTLNTIVLDDNQKHPVCLVIHGGSYVAGDKYNRRGLSKWLAANNFFVVNINYGLGPKYFLEEQVRHIGKAVEWLEANADKYNYDLDNAIVYGDSAGGYHATIAALFTLNKDMQEKYDVSVSFKFKKTVLICGMYDFDYAFNSIWYAKLVAPSLLKDALGCKKLKDYKHPELTNLIDLIPNNFPDSMLAYSEKDLLCPGQTQLLINKFEELGINYCEVHSSKFSDNHCYPVTWESKAAQDANKTILEYIK